MQIGRLLFREWLERSKQNQRTLAAHMGVSEGYLSQILSGVRRPKLELLVKIEDLSGVPVNSWVDTRRGKSGNKKKRSEVSANVSR